MGVGTSIFLASFLISSVLLYAHTKERWKWGKIFKISSISFLSLIFLCGTLFYCITYYENLPKTITEFEGIKLGDRKKDVVFKLGNPKEENKNTLEYNNIKVSLKDEKVNEIRLACYQGYYKGLNGIYCGDQSEALERKYKSSINQLHSEKDALFRIFQAPKYNTVYFLYQNKVIAMAIRATPFDEVMVDREAQIRQLEVRIARNKEILRLREEIEHEEKVQKERKDAARAELKRRGIY